MRAVDPPANITERFLLRCSFLPKKFRFAVQSFGRGGADFVGGKYVASEF